MFEFKLLLVKGVLAANGINLLGYLLASFVFYKLLYLDVKILLPEDNNIQEFHYPATKGTIYKILINYKNGSLKVTTPYNLNNINTLPKLNDDKCVEFGFELDKFIPEFSFQYFGERYKDNYIDISFFTKKNEFERTLLQINNLEQTKINIDNLIIYLKNLKANNSDKNNMK